MASGWFIDDIELEFAPTTDVRRISRTFQSETLFNFFPELNKSTARAFDYQISGFLLDFEAFALDEIAKSADTNIIPVIMPVEETIFKTTNYAVKELTIDRNKPRFTTYEGTPGIRVVAYTMVFTELADTGEIQSSLDGIIDANEEGLGLNSYNELIENESLELIDETFNLYTQFGIIYGLELAE
jgi:hypothetical protein